MSKHLQFLVLISSFFVFAFYFNAGYAATTPVNPLGVRNTTTPGYLDGLRNMVFTASANVVDAIKTGINGGKKDETRKDDDQEILDLGGSDDLGTSTASTTKNLSCPSDDPMVGCPLTPEQIAENQRKAEELAAQKNQQPPPPPPPPKEPPKMPELPKGGDAKPEEGMKEKDEPKKAKGKCKEKKGDEGEECKDDQGSRGEATGSGVAIENSWFDLFIAKVYAQGFGGSFGVWFDGKPPKAGDCSTTKDERKPVMDGYDEAYEKIITKKKGGQVKKIGKGHLGHIDFIDSGAKWEKCN